jgi:hypothetical protein
MKNTSFSLPLKKVVTYKPPPTTFMQEATWPNAAAKQRVAGLSNFSENSWNSQRGWLAFR